MSVLFSQYRFASNDYKWIKGEIESGNDEVRYYGVTNKGSQLMVKDIIHRSRGTIVGDKKVKVFGFYSDVFFILTYDNFFVFTEDFENSQIRYHFVIGANRQNERFGHMSDICVNSCYQYAYDDIGANVYYENS